MDEYQSASLPPLPGELPPRETAPPAPRQHNIFIGPYGVRAGWRVLIFYTPFLPFVVLQIIATLRREGTRNAVSLSATGAIVSEAIFLVFLLVPLFIISRVEKRSLGSYGLPLRGAFGSNFWVGTLLGSVSLTALLLAIRTFHGFYFGAIMLSGRELLKYALVWGIAFLMVGIFEEYFFRGYSQFVLTRGMGFWPAAIVTSLIFGVLHAGNPGESLVGLTAVVAVGLFFCLTLRRTGSLWFAVGFHAAWDYAQTFVYGVADSGFPSVGHLFNSHFQKGPVWLTGGTVGPEASWLVFPVLGIASLVVAWMYPEARYPEPKAPAAAAVNPNAFAVPQA